MARTTGFKYKKGSAGYERQKVRPVSREVREAARADALEVVAEMEEKREQKREVQREEHRTGRRFEHDLGPGINIPGSRALAALDRNAGVGGRPSIYDPLRFPHIGYVLCKERGFTNEELARVFDVSTKTVNQWMWQKPEFKKAVRRGRDEYDSENIEQALKKKALGYDYVEKHVTRTKIVGKIPDGADISVPAIVTTEITKHVQPDPRSIFYWLQNRQPDRWKHTMHIKVDAVPDGDEVEEQEMDIEDMSVEELRALQAMATKAVELKGNTIDITAPEKKQLTVEEILEAADRAEEHARLQDVEEKSKENEIPKRRKHHGSND